VFWNRAGQQATERGHVVTNPLLLTPEDVDRVFGLVSLISDPKGSKARLDAIVAAHAALDQARSSADAATKRHDAARGELMQAREAHAAELTKAREAHDAALGKARSEYDAQCAGRSRALDDREAKLAKREAETERAAGVAAAIKGQFEKRAADLRAAMS
jgi:hypothetical protein